MLETFQALVTKRTQIAHHIFLFELQGKSQKLPPFSAGSHIDVQIPRFPDLFRSYSLANDPNEENRYEIAILRPETSQGSATRFLCDQAMPGTVLTISAPHNTFPLDESANDSLFIAGGIGITPLRSMMLFLHQHHQSFSLVYTARTREETAFLNELSSWPEKIRFSFTREPPFQRIDMEQVIGPWKEGRKIYCCAPESLMQAVRITALALAWPAENICFERFSTPDLSSAAQKFDQKMHCEVIAAFSKKQTFAKPGETLLVTLRRMGIEVPSSCEAGTCGTCLVDLKEGMVEPHDLFLTPLEHASNKLAISCVGIPLGTKVVVEI